MTYMPHVNMWAWNLMGEDHVFFSQPTEACIFGVGYWIFPPAVAVARCGQTSSMGGHENAPVTDRAVWSYPIQCGRIATLMPDGRYLCELCCYTHYTCAVCRRYAVDTTWIRGSFACCSLPTCLETANAPPVPCHGCGVLLAWEEQIAGVCWHCHDALAP